MATEEAPSPWMPIPKTWWPQLPTFNMQAPPRIISDLLNSSNTQLHPWFCQSTEEPKEEETLLWPTLTRQPTEPLTCRTLLFSMSHKHLIISIRHYLKIITWGCPWLKLNTIAFSISQVADQWQVRNLSRSNRLCHLVPQYLRLLKEMSSRFKTWVKLEIRASSTL